MFINTEGITEWQYSKVDLFISKSPALLVLYTVSSTLSKGENNNVIESGAHGTVEQLQFNNISSICHCSKGFKSLAVS